MGQIDLSPTEIDRFDGETKSGERRTLVTHQNWRSYQPLNGPAHKLPGSREMFTVDGADVNDNRDGTFTILYRDEREDEVVRRIE